MPDRRDNKDRADDHRQDERRDRPTDDREASDSETLSDRDRDLVQRNTEVNSLRTK